MNICFKSGETYYSGFQRFNILADPAFRKCLLAFVPLMAIQTPGVMILRPGMAREIFFILLFLVYMVPAAFTIAGGMPASGWIWYIAAAACYAAGTIPIALGAKYECLLFMAPAAFCLMKVNKAAPHIFKALGYTSPAKPALEAALTVLLSSVIISNLWLGQILIRKSVIHFQAPEKYLWLAATSSLYYGALWGLLYGVLMRKFMDMRYNIVLPITLNVLLTSLYWIPSMLGYNAKLEMVIGGVILQGIVCHITFGMSYFYCRSTRPLLVAFVLQYLFLKMVTF